MTRQDVISDELWAVIEPQLPSHVGKPGRRWADHRRILEGIIWRYRTGAPWRDLPADFGPWQTVWKRHHRWSFDGTHTNVFLAVQKVYGPANEPAEVLNLLLSIDSTNVRVHQHAAGARNDVMTAAALTGGGTELHDSAT